MTAPFYAAAAAFAVSILLGPATIRMLRRLGLGQQVRAAGPASHQGKSGTPTMGGILILLAIIAASLLFGAREGPAVYAIFAATGFGLVGLADDLLSIAANRSLGLKARHKLIFEAVIAAVVVLSAWERSGTSLLIPFGGWWEAPAWLYFLLSAGTIVGFANAVNLTDGLDGLAAGTTAIAAAVFGLIAASLTAAELAVPALAACGACLGFAWFNAHPAQVFMGDTGSLALGGLLGSMAVLTGTPLILLIVGGVFVAETLSVMLQVVYFRLSGGRRIFRMAPLHHHFELIGWGEPKVVTRFWLVGLLLGWIGLVAAHVAGIPANGG